MSMHACGSHRLCLTLRIALFFTLRAHLHLIEKSIAVDEGSSENAPSVDYDCVSRPQGEGYDIVAYEIPEFPSTIIMSTILFSLTVLILFIRKNLRVERS